VKYNPVLPFIGADDPRCPLAGLKAPEEKTAEAYKNSGSADKFKVLFMTKKICF
jgi:hypothetical protein